MASIERLGFDYEVEVKKGRPKKGRPKQPRQEVEDMKENFFETDMGQKVTKAAKDAVVSIATDIVIAVLESSAGREIIISAITDSIKWMMTGGPVGSVVKAWVKSRRKNGKHVPEFLDEMFPDKSKPRAEEPEYQDEHEAYGSVSVNAASSSVVKKLKKMSAFADAVKLSIKAILKSGISPEDLMEEVRKELIKNPPKGYKWKRVKGDYSLVPSDERSAKLKLEAENLLRKAGVKFSIVGEHAIEWETEDYYVSINFYGTGATVEAHDGGPHGRATTKQRVNNATALNTFLTDNGLID